MYIAGVQLKKEKDVMVHLVAAAMGEADKRKGRVMIFHSQRFSDNSILSASCVKRTALLQGSPQGR